MTTGTFTTKIEPQLKWASSTPPSTGPRAMPTAAMAAQMAMARVRSLASGKTEPRIERVAGMIMAPPIPMKARVRMSALALVDSAAAVVPMPNTTRPRVSMPLRP